MIPSPIWLTPLLVGLCCEAKNSPFRYQQTFHKEPARRIGDTCTSRASCELTDVHSDCVQWRCSCKNGFKAESFGKGEDARVLCVTGFFPRSCRANDQCSEMDDNAYCSEGGVCDCQPGYHRQLVYWKYVCRSDYYFADKTLIIIVLSVTLLLLLIVLLYIGKHYVRSKCSGRGALYRHRSSAGSTSMSQFSTSQITADGHAPEWDLVVIPRAVRPPSPVFPSKEDLPPSYDEVMRFLEQSKR